MQSVSTKSATEFNKCLFPGFSWTNDKETSLYEQQTPTQK